MANTATRQVSIFINGKEVENTIKAIAAEKKKLQNEVAKLVVGTDEYKAGIKELGKLDGILRDHNNAIRGVEGAWNKNIPAVKNFIAAGAGLFAVDRIVSYGQELGTLAIQTDALARKSLTVLADQLGKVTTEAEKNAAAMGITEQKYVSATAGIADLLIPMGFQRDKAADISLQLVNLSGALAEWSGGTKTAEESQHALSAALLGEREELKSYGIAISEEDVKQRLLTKGMNDLTGSRLQQAKAIATLELVLEKSTDAQTSYATNTDSLIRQQALLNAKYEETRTAIAQKLEPLLASLSKGLLFLAGETGKASDNTAKLQAQFNIEIDTLKRSNLSQDTRKQLIEQINKSYGQYLPNLLTEKSSLQDIEKAQKAVNEVFLKKITLQAAEEELVEVSKKRIKVKKEELDLQKELTIAQDIYSKRAGTFNRNETGDEIILQYGNAKKAVDDNIAAQKKLEEQFNSTLDAAKKLGVDVNKFLGINKPDATTPTTADPESEKAKREREAKEKFYEDMKEKAKAFNLDLQKINGDGVEKEVLTIQKKYLAIFDSIKDFAKKYPSEQAKASIATKQFEELQSKEIREVYIKRFGEIEDELLKHQTAIAAYYLSDEDKQIAQINDKHAKQLKLLTALESDTVNANEAERTKAHTLRLQLEGVRGEEIAKLKKKLRSEQDQKDAEGNEKFFADMQKMRDDVQAFLDTKPVKLSVDADGTNFAEVKQNIIDIATAERNEVNKSADALLKKVGDAADERLKIENKRSQLLIAITKKTNAEIEKAETTSNDKRLKNQLLLAKEVGNAFVALSDLIAGETVKNSDLQKAAAIFQLGVDTATAISAVTAKNAASSATPIDYALKVAASIAIVLTNIARARTILSAAPTVNQKYDGGYTTVTGEKDKRQYNAAVSNNFEGGFIPSPTLLVGERGPEYVIPDYLLKNPAVANITRIIESIRTNRTLPSPQRYEGGDTQRISVVPTGPLSTDFGTNDRATIVLEKIYDALLSGRIIALVDTEGALKIDELIGRGKKIRGF
jgi:hypothetical protein